MNKPVINEQNVRGVSENLKKLDSDYDEVFTPKKVVMRTPPSDIQQPRESGKNIRPSHPETDINIGIKPKETSEYTSNVLRTAPLNQNSDNSTDMIEIILNALEKINNLSEKEKIERTNLKQLREASFKLHEEVTQLVYKLGKLETQNIKYIRKEEHQLKNNISEPSSLYLKICIH